MEQNNRNSITFLNDGPSEIVIPEQRYMSCRRCQYLKYELVRSGREPQYRRLCTNPVTADKYSLEMMFKEKGREIESEEDPVKTPTWCPILNKKEDEK